ncbi:MAG: hypothetical protein JSS03_10690 [Proteobacteria bacterium]|nr:hypothetical protein [Pseudomonadota bacterium]
MRQIAVYSTNHARARQRQRGIPDELLGLLLRFGQRRRDGHGAWLAFFDKRARQRLQRQVDDKTFARWESRLGVYAVLSRDAVVVTVGQRLMRLYRAH